MQMRTLSHRAVETLMLSRWRGDRFEEAREALLAAVASTAVAESTGVGSDATG